MPATRANRNSLLAQIHIAKKALGWDDEQYRSLLQTVCQVKSSGDLDTAGLLRFLDHCKRCGWNGSHAGRAGKTSSPTRKKALNPQERKVYSLWQQLFEAGQVKDRSFKAMEAWCKAQTGVDKLSWHNAAQLGQCIEQAKAWLAREGR